MKKPKQQWLRGWMREKVRAGEIPSWVFDCLDGEIPGEIPAPDGFSSRRATLFLTWNNREGVRVASCHWTRSSHPNNPSLVRTWNWIGHSHVYTTRTPEYLRMALSRFGVRA